MQLSAQGRAFLEQREGFRVKRYPDSAGRPTIGVGHLITAEELAEGKLAGTGFPTDILTADQVDQQFAFDVKIYEQAVEESVGLWLCTQNQFDACVALCFNIGTHGFAGSGVAHCIAMGDDVDMPWRQWNKVRDKDTHQLVVDPGLVRRRQFELDLYHKPGDPVAR